MNKVMVASIMRDEARNIDDWYASVQHADKIVLVDTGSSDDSVALAEYYVGVHHDMTVLRMLPADFDGPVAYDVARSMACACADHNTICMWLDLDERFISRGLKDWTVEIRELPDHVDLVNVQMDLVGDQSIVYKQAKGFRGGTHYWKYAVHEVLKPVGQLSVPHEAATFNTLHLQEPHKKYRSYHLDLLLRDYACFPHDERVLFYLTRQYAYALSDMIEDSNVPDEAIIAYYQQNVSRCFGLLRSIARYDDFITWAALEIARAVQSHSMLATEGALHAMIAHTYRPDRVETLGQLCISHYYSGEDLACVAFGIRCMETTMPVDSNFMFDYSNYYLQQVPAFVIKSLESLQLIDKAHFYAHKFQRTDLLERIGE